MANLFPKRCKVYPRNNMQFISGILKNQKRIELPAELPLSEKELRRCLSYGNCFEMVGGKHVLLTLENFNKDNKDGKDVTSTLPEGELSKPRDKEEEEEEGDTSSDKSDTELDIDGGVDEEDFEDEVVVANEKKVEPKQAPVQPRNQKPQNNQSKNQKNDSKQK